MIISSNGKNINTLAFQNLLTQGEKGSEKIVFLVDRFYNDVDLGSCLFVIKGLNENNEVAQQMLSSYYSGDDKIQVVWDVENRFTACAGKLKLELQVYDSLNDEPKFLLKYSLPAVYIKETINGENIPTPSIAEQIMTDVNNAVGTALAEIDSAILDGLSEINKKINAINLTDLNERMIKAESEISDLKGNITIKMVSMEEYLSTLPDENVLYVIS